MIRKLLCLIFIITAYQVAGQSSSRIADSLKNILPKYKQDTIRVKLLNQIALYSSADSDNVVKFANEALSLSKKLKYNPGIIESYLNLGYAQQHIGNVSSEFDFLNKALEVSTKTKNHKKTSEVYTRMGLNQYTINDEKAMEYFKKALRISESINDYRVVNDVLLQMGGVYRQKGKLYEAADCFSKVMVTGEKNNDEGAIITGSTYLAGIYTSQRHFDKALEYKIKALKLLEKKNNKSAFTCFLLTDIGNIYVEKEKYQVALTYYNKASDYLKNSNNTSAQAEILLSMNTAYRALGQIQKADETIQKASIIALDLNSNYGKVQINRMLGEANFAAEKYDVALYHHVEALKAAETGGLLEEQAIQYGNIGATYYMLAKEGSNLRTEYCSKSIEYLTKALPALKRLSNISRLELYSGYLADVYELAGQPDKALKAYKESIVYRDSVFNKGKRDEFNAKQMDYEYGKKEALLKERQSAEMEKEKTMRNISFAGVGVLFVVAGGAGVAYRRKKRDNTIIAKEKKRSDELLLNILPAEVAEELKEKGEAAAHYYEHVSILFTDFEGFTQISSKMSPREVIGELNYCFKAFDTIITKYNIEKIKTIGDAYMAVSGMPSSSPDHALNVVRAAIEIRDFIVDYKEQRQREGKIYFEMRIGINSGEVVAGIVGIKKFAYDIWGDAVNIAARMESNGVVGKINISESTYELVKDEFDAEYRGEIEAKGKGKVSMYFVEPKKSEIGI